MAFYIDINSVPSNVDVTAVASDGGTLAIKVTVGSETYGLYVDNRIETDTPNEIYTDYPDSADARMLLADSVLVKGIKGMLKSE